ncbi:MAG: Prokaryotic dksA/traR C4-type zinc finger [Actinomycetota bacterium]|nr:Prokaryotic dksA/traR C4-type zinc finger [Actinomycetota bacterium]
MEEPPLTPADLDQAERDVEGVEDAIGRLDDGTYGTCVVCGAPIAEAVLAAAPSTRTCASHSS